MRLWLAVGAAGCGPAPAERFLVVDGRGGDYALVEAPIPALADPVRMEGALGDGRVGGYLDVEALEYRGGGPIRVRYSVQDGLAIPHTDDGLVLWSYYHTLGVLGEELEALGVDPAQIFPVDFAYQPNVGGSLFTTTNAAYLGSGIHLFALLADTARTDLPLAANPGVIRHEFGHALFQQIVAGSVQDEAPSGSAEVRALNEGFADMLATLTLDDPGFLSLSLPVPQRRVDQDASVSDAAPVEDDPYSRGTVFASLAWDLRELTDPDTALLLAVGALQRWASSEPPPWEEGLAGIDRWASLLVQDAVAARPELAPELCAAYEARMDTAAPEGCL
jgi:hypothetical protein